MLLKLGVLAIFGIEKTEPTCEHGESVMLCGVNGAETRLKHRSLAFNNVLFDRRGTTGENGKSTLTAARYKARNKSVVG